MTINLSFCSLFCFKVYCLFVIIFYSDDFRIFVNINFMNVLNFFAAGQCVVSFSFWFFPLDYFFVGFILLCSPRTNGLHIIIV